MYLEQTGDLSVAVYVDLLCSRNLGQTGHGHDRAGLYNNKACTGSQTSGAHVDNKLGRAAEQRCVIGERILRLGDNDGKPALALRLYRLYLFQRFLRKIREGDLSAFRQDTLSAHFGHIAGAGNNYGFICKTFHLFSPSLYV